MIAPRPEQQFGTSRVRIAVTFTGTVFMSKKDDEGHFIPGSTILLTRRERESMRRALAEADVQDALWCADNGH